MTSRKFRSSILIAGTFVFSSHMTATAWAQAQGVPYDSTAGLLEVILSKVDSGEIVGMLGVILIFGTGMIATSLFGLAAIIKAVRGEHPDVAELFGRVEQIEARLDAIAPAKGEVGRLPESAPETGAVAGRGVA